MHRYFLIPVLGFFAFICIFVIYLQFINDDWKFSDYKYKCSCAIPKDNNNINTEFRETFVDIETNNVRQNESHLYMEKIDTILKYATNNGFIQHGKINMKNSNGDKNQYLYILERSL